MQLRRSTIAALMFTALIVGWLLPAADADCTGAVPGR